MTPEQVKEFFQEIVDDAPDEDITVYGLMDSAYTLVNEERPWSFLLKLDSSLSHSPGDTWQTEKTLPADFGDQYKLFGGASDNEYLGVPFHSILQFKDESNRYTVDMANLKLRLTGSTSSNLTMYLWYKYFPTSLFGLSAAQKISTSTIVWPARFRRILAYKMAEIFFGGMDADEVVRAMAPADRLAYTELKRAMIQWDNRIMLRLFQNSSSLVRADSVSRPDVVDW